MKTPYRTVPISISSISFARGLALVLLFAAALPLRSGAQTLPVTAGLQLWLKADAGITTNSSGLVTKWADQSGMGNDAIQTDSANAPSLVLNSLNGKPTLRFPGDTRYLDVADSASIAALTEDVTILALVLYDDVSTLSLLCDQDLGQWPGSIRLVEPGGVGWRRR